MLNKQVKVIKPKINLETLSDQPLQKLKKRVCAYCRVSTDNDEQKTSYDAQVDEYTTRIKNNPEWSLAKIYADEGISGTSTKKRKQFNEMIQACRDGLIDLIITKSISRFARNTVDCLNYIRELRTLNVEIFFEKENIYSSDTKVDFLLTIMASISQEEARNVSENVKWNVAKRFKEGVPIVNHKRFLGYTKDKKGGNLVIIPEEAEIVKKIFTLYTSRVAPTEIMRYLESKGYKTGAGKSKWTNSSLISILRNEKYCGDLLQQKTLTVDYLSHKKVKNHDLAPKYHIENNHEAIIDKETFLLAQQIRAERAAMCRGIDKNIAKYCNRYPFSGLIICSKCVRTLKRRYWNYGTPAERVMQQCGSYIDGKGNCDAKATYQEMIEGATIKMLNEVFIKNLNIMPIIKKVISETVIVTDVTKEIDNYKIKQEKLETTLSELVDMKLNNPALSDRIFNEKYQEANQELVFVNKEIDRLEKENLKNFDTTARLNKINEVLSITKQELTEIETDTLRSFIYKIISISPEEIIFCVAGTKNYNDEEFVSKLSEFIKSQAIAESSYHSVKYNKDINYKVIII